MCVRVCAYVSACVCMCMCVYARVYKSICVCFLYMFVCVCVFVCVFVHVCVLAGVSVGALKDGSGVLVRSVLEDGCVGRDGRLEAGDVILAINGEGTSNMTSAKARALLRRHSVIGPEIQ